MKSRSQKRPGKRQLYFLNDHGMVTCNPRNREAAHRIEMYENKIELSVKNIYARFTIVSGKNASVIFTTNENQYEKKLIKIRDNPSVLCD